MTCFCSSHWLTPNWSRMSWPLMTRNFVVELLLQLALPLEGEVGRADDQDALGEPPSFELADEQARP